MKLIGRIKHLQVQRNPLKVGERPNRVYDPSALYAVTAFRLTTSGILGIDGNETIVDAHHQDHPLSRNRQGMNGISFNFTGHYDQLMAKFGEHMTLGCAGENIIIENVKGFSSGDLGPNLIIKRDSGQTIYFSDVMVAPPCAEFSCYAAKQKIDGAQLKSTLQFLDNGLRGYYTSLTPNQGEMKIQIGDQVFVD